MVNRIFVVCLVMALPALAEDPAQRRAREELEHQLNSMVEKAPSRVRVEFQPIDDPNLQIEELEVIVDGKVLKTPTQAAISAWQQDGPMPVGAIDVVPGRHKVVARATIHHTASPLVTDEGDHRWKVSGDVGFDVATGLEVKVTVAPVRDGAQHDLAKRYKLTFPSKPSMIAKLDDGSMPEPMKALPPKVIPADAGAVAQLPAGDDEKARLEAAKAAAAEEKKRKLEEAKLAKAAAAEEKKRKLEEAKLAKAAAAEAKKRKLEEAKLAKAAAAEEKKRKLEEATLAKAAAAEEKKRKLEEATLAMAAAARLGEPVAVDTKHAMQVDGPFDAGPDVAGAEVAIDAGASLAVVEAAVEVDAGAPLIAAAPVDAGLPFEPDHADPEADDPPPWPLIAGGVAMALAVFVLISRRASRVPTIKE